MGGGDNVGVHHVGRVVKKRRFFRERHEIADPSAGDGSQRLGAEQAETLDLDDRQEDMRRSETLPEHAREARVSTRLDVKARNSQIADRLVPETAEQRIRRPEGELALRGTLTRP